jgi:hypothetical protein
MNPFFSNFIMPHKPLFFLVTGDKEILRLKEYRGIKMVSLRNYIES